MYSLGLPRNLLPFWVLPAHLFSVTLLQADQKAMRKSNTLRASFAHRENDDGTVDSICLACFQTVGECERERDLQNAEDGHVCDPWVVEHYRQLRQEILKYRHESRGHAGRA